MDKKSEQKLKVSGDIRTVKDGDHFPYRTSASQFILVTENGVEIGRNLDGKQRVLRLSTKESEAGRSTLLLATWHGEWRTDIFLINEYKATVAVYNL